MTEFSQVNPNTIPLELLLEADPDTRAVENYLQDSICFVAHLHNKIIAACIVKPTCTTSAEIFNVSVFPEYQKMGIGSELLHYVIKTLSATNITRLELGTGTFGHQLTYYQRAGFRVDSVIKNHFLDSYDQPIWENGIQHKDMLRLYLDLPPND
ncbi:GNAT family N-acetyltransferase [Vibrio intestinalis]|uniref:GNAT family N-acetyltransferase n=1 Tax=Vibrio intestinalis TaxID=2933291 RepID=UPI0021A3855C|nr:GNAT family N-acetyltransferase [Vibrio intestinalis]